MLHFEIIISRGATSQEFEIELKFEFTKNLQTVFKFFIFNLASSSSSSVIFTELKLFLSGLG